MNCDAIRASREVSLARFSLWVCVFNVHAKTVVIVEKKLTARSYGEVIIMKVDNLIGPRI